jgi:hypothetical protein
VRLLSAIPFFVLLFGSAASATAVEWPSSFVVHSGTGSPGGRYGILVPPHVPESDEDSNCYLADIQSLSWPVSRRFWICSGESELAGCRNR